MKKFKLYFIFNILLITTALIFGLTCNAQNIGNSLLPKPTPTPEQLNIADNFKLIAVYLIAKQPRALIKNLAIPEEGAKEFLTGDFLDEYQTIQVSKISLNPTTRVELIDQNGYAYLIKPQSFDSKAGGSKGAQGKAAPTYFGGQAKSKPKKERDSASAEKPEKQDKQDKAQTADGLPKKEEPLDKPSKPAVDTTSQTQAQQPTGTTSQALQPTTTTSASLSAPSAASQKAPPAPAQALPQGQDSLDNRPVNPFGQ